MEPRKVLESLKACENPKGACSRCWYRKIEKCYEALSRDALELINALKAKISELETKEENIHKEEDGHE